jgi:hypothetical protein
MLPNIYMQAVAGHNKVGAVKLLDLFFGLTWEGKFNLKRLKV